MDPSLVGFLIMFFSKAAASIISTSSSMSLSPCLEVEAGGDTDRDRDRDLEPDLDLDLLSSGDIIGEENLLANPKWRLKF